MAEQTFAEITDRISQELQDTGNTNWGDPEIKLAIADGLIEVSQYDPYTITRTFEVETRQGSASATTAGALVDTGVSQFLAGDVGKYIFNDDDNTWAEVTAFVSTSQLTLSKDIFTVGETYRMFNKYCWNNRQLNIADEYDNIIDFASVEYPTQRFRRNIINEQVLSGGRVLELDLMWGPDDTSVTGAEKEVFVEYTTRHRLNAMSDLAASLTGAHAAGVTSLTLGDLTDADTPIQKGELLEIAGIRGIYRATADATISSNSATLAIFPGLESAGENSDVVTFIGSTFTQRIEWVFPQLVAGRLAISKTRLRNDGINKGGSAAADRMREWGERKVEAALRELRKLKKPNQRKEQPDLPYLGRNRVPFFGPGRFG